MMKSPAVLNPEISRLRRQSATRFQTAQPFRHVVLEGFFADTFLDRLRAQFPPFAQGNARNEAGAVGGKAVVERIRALGPAYAELDALIQTPEFLTLIGEITGIADLKYDRHYFGGGTHENRHGQDLDAHIDFNRHPVHGWQRRLNLIVYLNEQWKEQWGGCLELHSDPRSSDDQITRIAPTLNRCVIFETTEWSWHGFDRIDLPDAGRACSRRSIALYFYTETRPADELASPHSTVYVDRPLPAQLQPGHALDKDDVEELRELLGRRDQHIARLYQEAAQLTAQVDALTTRLRQGVLGQLAYYVRAALAAVGLGRRSP